MKPYGYVWTSLKDGMETRFTNIYPNEFYKPFDIVPVYTHPVKELKNIVLASATCSCGKVMEVTNLQPVKELTDEEINEVFSKTWLDLKDYKEFARAILRKAQEK